jgi:uncharacterized membrane protein (DUF485 family)
MNDGGRAVTMFKEMLPKERFAWVWLAALLLIFGVYFTVVAVTKGAELTPLFQISRLSIALGSLAVIALAAHFLTGIHRGEARGVFDERDHRIEQRSFFIGYYTLIIGMIVVGCMMPFNQSGWDIVNPALLTIAIAEILRYGYIVLSYRRGLHE